MIPVADCTLAIRLKPKAKNDRIVVAGAGAPLEVAVTSPPVENRANEHCIALLAKKLRVPKSNLSIIKGGHSRDKVVACSGVSQEAALRMLSGES
jgi:uncharacterized protein (TIGR00251 family)